VAACSSGVDLRFSFNNPPSCRVVEAEPSLEPSRAPILTLSTRTLDLAVYTGIAGPRFTVLTPEDGLVLADRVTEGQLALLFPALHDHFKTALADDDIRGIWAGLDEPTVESSPHVDPPVLVEPD